MRNIWERGIEITNGEGGWNSQSEIKDLGVTNQRAGKIGPIRIHPVI